MELILYIQNNINIKYETYIIYYEKKVYFLNIIRNIIIKKTKINIF
jgi:hypothetical protein